MAGAGVPGGRELLIGGGGGAAGCMAVQPVEVATRAKSANMTGAVAALTRVSLEERRRPAVIGPNGRSGPGDGR